MQILFLGMLFALKILANRAGVDNIFEVVNVVLGLLYYTVLSFSRDAIRKACLSYAGKDDWSLVINFTWLT